LLTLDRRVLIVAAGALVAAGLGTGIALATDGEAQRESSGTTTATAFPTTTLVATPPGEPTDVQVFAEGECFFELNVVPCSEVHTQEDFARFRITGASRAGQRTATAPPLFARMGETCNELFAQYTGITVLPDPRYSVGYAAAGLSSDGLLHEVTCVTTGLRGNLDPLTGSAKGVGTG
jgi:hypothetical protein